MVPTISTIKSTLYGYQGIMILLNRTIAIPIIIMGINPPQVCSIMVDEYSRGALWTIP
jgi:hypothetical protein